jgi:outer membrane immunogenic protein
MLRKLLMTTALVCLASGAALAADLPSEKGPPVYAPPPPPPVFSWTGVYIGGQVGYGWGNTSSYDALGGYPSLRPDGVVGGAHIGYNYQVSQFVFGVEGDVNGSDEHDSFALSPTSGFSIRKDVDTSIRGRIGYTFDRVLIYATGGGAYGNFHTTDYGPGVFSSYNHGHIGYTVGGGIEYAIDNNWSVRAEYRYTDYGHITDSAVPADGGLDITRRVRDNRAQLGFSYKFDMFAPPAPIVSKY